MKSVIVIFLSTLSGFCAAWAMRVSSDYLWATCIICAIAAIDTSIKCAAEDICNAIKEKR